MTQIARTTALWSTLLALCVTLTGCEVVGKIFKFGVWTGVVMVGLVVLLAFGAMRFMRRT